MITPYFSHCINLYNMLSYKKMLTMKKSLFRRTTFDINSEVCVYEHE